MNTAGQFRHPFSSTLYIVPFLHVFTKGLTIYLETDSVYSRTGGELIRRDPLAEQERSWSSTDCLRRSGTVVDRLVHGIDSASRRPRVAVPAATPTQGGGSPALARRSDSTDAKLELLPASVAVPPVLLCQRRTATST